MSTKPKISIKSKKSEENQTNVEIQEKKIPAFLQAVNERREQIKTKVSSRSSIRRPGLRRSIFFMTISTNMSINSMIPEHQIEFREQFENTCREFFYDNNGKEVSDLMELRDSKEVNDQYQNIPLYERIEDADIHYKTEIGPRGILHAHARVTTSQRAVNVKLDYNGLREWFHQKLGYKIYFHNDPIKDIKQTLDEYIDKQIEYY